MRAHHRCRWVWAAWLSLAGARVLVPRAVAGVIGTDGAATVPATLLLDVAGREGPPVSA